jgi:hypothetical protein
MGEGTDSRSSRRTNYIRTNRMQFRNNERSAHPPPSTYDSQHQKRFRLLEWQVTNSVQSWFLRPIRRRRVRVGDVRVQYQISD